MVAIPFVVLCQCVCCECTYIDVGSGQLPKFYSAAVSPQADQNAHWQFLIAETQRAGWSGPVESLASAYE